MAKKYTREEFIAAFWARVDKTPGHGPEGECWVWLGCRIREGYGQVRFDGRLELTHRVSYRLEVGEIPPDKPCILHSCDFPPCCRPSHLFPGTIADNAADRDAKGRAATGERHGSRTKPERLARGDRNGSAKITEADIPDIRERLARKESQASIAADYGVKQPTISRIGSYETWKHVPKAGEEK